MVGRSTPNSEDILSLSPVECGRRIIECTYLIAFAGLCAMCVHIEREREKKTQMEVGVQHGLDSSLYPRKLGMFVCVANYKVWIAKDAGNVKLYYFVSVNKVMLVYSIPAREGLPTGGKMKIFFGIQYLKENVSHKNYINKFSILCNNLLFTCGWLEINSTS